MRTLILAALAAGLLSVAAPVAARPAVAPTAGEDRRFAAFGDRLVDAMLRFDPVNATQLGDHRFDNALPDVSPAGRAARRAFATRALADLARFDRAALSPEQQVDAILLADQLRLSLFSLDRLRDWAWDPLTYASAAGSALFTLSSREFAPWPVRLHSATLRLEALPGFLRAERTALVPARVPRIHAETAAKQNGGLNGLIDDLLVHRTQLPPDQRARLDRAAAEAKAAVAAHQAWLDKQLTPNAGGDARLGAALYDEKLRLSLNSPLSRQDIRARAVADLAAMRVRMYAIAAGMVSGRPGAPPAPAHPTAAEQQAVIAAGLAIVYADAPAPDEVIPFARRSLVEATEFVTAHGIVSVPPASYNVIEMPEYARGFAVAYADMPGPFERDQRGFYAVMPIPADWTAEQRASFLRENNRWALRELTLHEAMPGHLLQLAHANADGSRLRAFFASNPMIEGWACYGEEVMADAGYLNRDPRYLLAHYKFLMRLPVNAILDQDFHTGALTREAAMKLMTEDAFQEEREAAGKWVRLQLSSTQLPVYFVGAQEWRDLRAEAERRPGFDLKRFHDAALSHGSPPVRFIRELEFGAPIE